MKKQFLTTLVFLGVVLFLSGSLARAGSVEPVPLAIQSLLMPLNGYDDNDSVQLMIHGELPNACYQLSNASFELKAGNNIVLRQFANHLTDGLCGEEEVLPDYMRIPVLFTTEISLGTLKAGDYRIEYTGTLMSRKTLSLRVTQSEVPTVDDRLYADVTQVIAPDVFVSGNQLKVILSGVYNSDCVELDPQPVVLRQGEVSIILPHLTVNAEAVCRRQLRPFSREVNLGRVDGVHHLVHVRSMNGRGVSRWVDLIEE